MLLRIIRDRYSFPNFPDWTVDRSLHGRQFPLKQRTHQDCLRHPVLLTTTTRLRISVPLLQQGLPLPNATVTHSQHEAHRQRGYSYTG